MALSRELVRAEVDGRRLVLLYLSPEKPEPLGMARALLEAFVERVGRTRGELEEAAEEIALAARSGKAARGLAEVLLGECEFRRVDAVAAIRRRRDVFERAVAARREGRFDRERILAEAGFEGGEDLYPDLRSAERLEAVPDLDPAGLVRRYNAAMVESVLPLAGRFQAEIEDDRPEVRERVLEAAGKARVEARGRRVRLAIDSPGGKGLGSPPATLFEAIRGCRSWRCEATVAWGRGRRRLELVVGRVDPL